MKTKFQFVLHCFGIIVKILSNIILIPINGIYERGAIIGNILSNITSFIIVYVTLRKKVKLKLSFLNLIVKPFFASSIMIISSLYIYKIFICTNINSNVCTIISIITAIVIYIFSVFVTKMLNKNRILESFDKTGKRRIPHQKKLKNREKNKKKIKKRRI